MSGDEVTLSGESVLCGLSSGLFVCVIEVSGEAVLCGLSSGLFASVAVLSGESALGLSDSFASAKGS